jgi:protein-S-isoprenylcysteine O-methyltransferase Ste14
VNRPLASLGAAGLLLVFLRALADLANPNGLGPFVVIASFIAYLAAAQLALVRARLGRGPRVNVGTGVAQWGPAFAWVPYAVVVTHLGPELAVPQAVTWIGLALTVGGIAFALWALRTIGRQFDLELEVHQGHEVVRTGPYAAVRHPIYTGLLIHTVGACVATGNVFLAAGSLFVTFPLLYLRARTEERLLRAQLGAAYDAYAREVGMLIPFVGRGAA